MIIRKAKAADKDRVEKAWRSIFAHDDNGHSDFYFKFAYDPFQCFLLTSDNDELISACQVHEKSLVFANKVLKVSFIVGLLTLPQHRRQGYMKKLLTEVLEIQEHKHHFTLIQAYDPSLYLKYGFEPIYERVTYTLEAAQVPVISSTGISYQISADAMLSLYKTFTKHFDGYVRREIEDFKKLQHEVQSQNGKIIGFIQNGKLEAYACVLFENGKVIFDEVVYLNANALLKCLNAMTSLNKVIEVKVSPKENLKKILGNAQSQTDVYTFVKINDLKLFNELFKANVHNAQEAFLLSEKPLWIRENQ